MNDSQVRRLAVSALTGLSQVEVRGVTTRAARLDEAITELVDQAPEQQSASAHDTIGPPEEER
ncbi:hypothetical protein F4560_002981 [Saccharothrix ecbatanensis]|uniref:Uncharacterized protein n=1 Tax=Saccharothrix ecbatanensis TaxID=1105145 RepID=A0A7W9HJR6_9PSEU|nr:hypothetical protein [Saccharothrix ecbatanensis]MBB5803213.1 hypothetical protein [Saccharothrix ecbatanensis]